MLSFPEMSLVLMNKWKVVWNLYVTSALSITMACSGLARLAYQHIALDGMFLEMRDFTRSYFWKMSVLFLILFIHFYISWKPLRILNILVAAWFTCQQMSQISGCDAKSETINACVNLQPYIVEIS